MWRADSLEKILMLGKIEGRRRRGSQRMRWLDGITDSTDKSLEMVKDRLSLAFCSPRGRKDSDRTQWLNNNNTSYIILIRRKKKSSSAYSGKVDTTPTANVADDVKKSLRYIKMNPPQVYMCSPSWTLLPPPSPSFNFMAAISWLQSPSAVILEPRINLN